MSNLTFTDLAEAKPDAYLRPAANKEHLADTKKIENILEREETLASCRICNDPKILFETDNFKVLPDYNPLAPGHLLITTKDHVFCMASFDEAQLTELEALKIYLRQILKDIYGQDVVFFEHGSTILDEENKNQGGNSIVHAHLHAVPVPKKFEILKILNDNRHCRNKPINTLNEISKHIGVNEGYLFYENQEGKKFVFILEDSYTVPSQYVRQIAGEMLGNKLWDWKNASDETKVFNMELVDRTVRELLPKFKAKIKIDNFKAAMAEVKGKVKDYNKSLKELDEVCREKRLAGKTPIIFAEALLDNGAVLDLKESLGVLTENKTLDKVIIYAGDSVKGDVVEKLAKEIKGINPDGIIRPEEGEIPANLSEADEINALIEFAETKGVNTEDILCVIKGKTKEREALERLSEKRKISIVIFESRGGMKEVYSMAVSLKEAIAGKEKEPINIEEPKLIEEINLWEDKRVIELAGDLKKNGLENFKKAEKKDEKIEKFRVYEHKNGLQIVKKIKVTADIMAMKELFSRKGRWVCPTFFIDGQEKYHYELNLIPLGYQTLSEALGNNKIKNLDEVRVNLNRAIKKTYRRGEENFFYAELHDENVLVKLDSEGNLKGLKFIDWDQLQQKRVSDLKNKNAEWAKFIKGERKNLINVNLLSGMFDLMAFDFERVYLTRSVFAFNYLRWTNNYLGWSNFKGAILTGARFWDMCLEASCFRNAILSKTKFQRVILNWGDFRRAHLSEIWFDRVHMLKTKFDLEWGKYFEKAGLDVKNKKDWCEVSGYVENLKLPFKKLKPELFIAIAPIETGNIEAEYANFENTLRTLSGK